jgi:hypothetical protein
LVAIAAFISSSHLLVTSFRNPLQHFALEAHQGHHRDLRPSAAFKPRMGLAF